MARLREERELPGDGKDGREGGRLAGAEKTRREDGKTMWYIPYIRQIDPM